MQGKQTGYARFSYGNGLLARLRGGTGRESRRKENRRKPVRLQRLDMIQNGGRSRTRIYDLHDVNVEECLYYQWFVKLFGKNSVNSVFI